MHLVSMALAVQRGGNILERSEYITHTLSEGDRDIGDIELLGESLTFAFDLSEIVARHGWEDVMLNLIVKSSHEKVGEDAGVNIARGQDLETEIGQILITLDNRAPAVVQHEGHGLSI